MEDIKPSVLSPIYSTNFKTTNTASTILTIILYFALVFGIIFTNLSLGLLLGEKLQKRSFKTEAEKIYKIYRYLYKIYGPQGWWPLLESGYERGSYRFDKSDDEIFEVALGTILTQNTTFTSVVKALNNLKDLDALSYRSIKELDLEILKTAIKPAGYYNQKARYILEFISFFESLRGRVPSRDELLGILGIGEESADSILLYGYSRSEFKVDAYTKRVLLELDLIDERAKYRDIKELMQESLKEFVKDEEELVKVYQEYHALIVCHSKEFYSKKPYGVGCILKERFG